MYKCILVVFLFLHVNSFGGAYKTNCMSCHRKLEVGIDKFFYRYLLNYSSEQEVKKAIKSYLLRPTKKKSLLADGLILRYGLKPPTQLSKKRLDEAVNEYWRRYNLFGKLK